jgi:hypothetical protein
MVITVRVPDAAAEEEEHAPSPEEKCDRAKILDESVHKAMSFARA